MREELQHEFPELEPPAPVLPALAVLSFCSYYLRFADAFGKGACLGKVISVKETGVKKTGGGKQAEENWKGKWILGSFLHIFL